MPSPICSKREKDGAEIALGPSFLIFAYCDTDLNHSLTSLVI